MLFPVTLWIIFFSLFAPIRNDRIVVEDRRLLALGQGSAWFWNPAAQVVEQVDLTTGHFTDVEIAIHFELLTGSIESGSLWVLSNQRDQVVQIDLTTYEPMAMIDIGDYFEEWEFANLVAGEGTVWIKGEEIVLQIYPQIGEPIPAGEEILVAAVANGELWTGSHDDGLITRIDLETGEITAQFELGFSVHGLALDENAAWILDEHGFAIVQVDLKTNQSVARIPITFIASSITAGEGDLWVVPAAYDSGQPLNNDTFIRIDGQTLEIEEEVDIGLIRSRQDGSYLVLEADGEAWAVIFDDTLTTLVQLSDH